MLQIDRELLSRIEAMILYSLPLISSLVFTYSHMQGARSWLSAAPDPVINPMVSSCSVTPAVD